MFKDPEIRNKSMGGAQQPQPCPKCGEAADKPCPKANDEDEDEDDDYEWLDAFDDDDEHGD